jgi:alpha-glucosidase (family GH31 glycosyl hydrolase)
VYNLGEQFTFDYNLAKPLKENVIQGQKYRFTILTERLIRIEYNEYGEFLDKPTELVWFRNMPKVTYLLKQTDTILEITTKYFKLTYLKEKPFEGSKINPVSNLKIELLTNNKQWYYKHPEVRNFGSPSLSLDENKGKIKVKRGLYSIDGFASIDDSKSNIMTSSGTIEQRQNETIDTYVFLYGTDFEGCLRDYYMITGAPALIPRYALGVWWSRNINYSEDMLYDLVNDFEEREIPISVLLLDKDWHIRNLDNSIKNTGFSWNRNLLPSPKKMIGDFHEKGIHTGLNVNPIEGIYPYEDNFSYITNYLEKDENGNVPFQVLNPRYIDVYLKFLINPLDAVGVDFYWIDISDKENAYPLWILDHYQFYNNLSYSGKRPMLLTRNMRIAPHRYPVLYSGKTVVNWETLRTVTMHNVEETNMGMNFWAHDIGGNSKGLEDSELYTRFIQFGTFAPILKFGTEGGKYYKREPWAWNYKTYEIAKRYLKLRHQLIPYLYSESYKYHKYGKPLITPLYYKYPDFYDDPTYNNEYYLGSSIFIAPITKKKEPIMDRVIHRFYLPEGIWFDYVTGKKYKGDKGYLSFFKDEDYPVFVKAGSILPLVNDHKEYLNNTKPPKNMEIQIFPGASSQYELYEDDGETELYKEGNFLRTIIEYNYLPNNHTVIIRSVDGKPGIVPDRRNYRICFRNTIESDDVIVYFNDQKIECKKYVKYSKFVIEVEDVPTIGQLTINCKGRDVEISAEEFLKRDFESIIFDLPIKTDMKEKVDSILFSDMPIRKKRIAIRHLQNHGLERRFIKLFLKLLEYMAQI